MASLQDRCSRDIFIENTASVLRQRSTIQELVIASNNTVSQYIMSWMYLLHLTVDTYSTIIIGLCGRDQNNLHLPPNHSGKSSSIQPISDNSSSMHFLFVVMIWVISLQNRKCFHKSNSACLRTEWKTFFYDVSAIHSHCIGNNLSKPCLDCQPNR